MQQRSGIGLVSFLVRATIALCGLWIVTIPVCLGREVVDRVERTFSVKERPLLFIRNSDGKTILRTASGSEVRVVVVKEVQKAANTEEARSAAAKVEVRIVQSGNRIEMEAKYPKFSASWNDRPQVLVHFDVTAPVGSDIDAHNSDGPLEVTGFNGQLDLSTSDGKLTALDCSGRVRAHVSDGEMRIEGLTGELEARTSDGSMTLDGSFKALDVKSSDGKVDITVRPGSVMERAWSLSSSDGSIRMHLPDGFKADLDINTSDGDIRVDQPVTLAGTQKSEHRLSGKLNSGGFPLHIHTSDGSVAILK